jgi:hypothetical protein
VQTQTLLKKQLDQASREASAYVKTSAAALSDYGGQVGGTSRRDKKERGHASAALGCVEQGNGGIGASPLKAQKGITG